MCVCWRARRGEESGRERETEPEKQIGRDSERQGRRKREKARERLRDKEKERVLVRHREKVRKGESTLLVVYTMIDLVPIDNIIPYRY